MTEQDSVNTQCSINNVQVYIIHGKSAHRFHIAADLKVKCCNGFKMQW